MEITDPDKDRYWHQIAAHTAASKNGSHTGAPWPLQIQIAALLGNSAIVASVARYDGSAPTTWEVSLITTDTRLIRVSMQFDAEQYDADQDQNSPEPLVPDVQDSWVRRLDDINSITIGRSRMRPNSFGRVLPNVLDVADVELTFRDGVVVDLGIDQLGMTLYDDRGRTDGFIDLLRGHIGL